MAAHSPTERAKDRGLQLAAIYLDDLSPLAALATLSLSIHEHQYVPGSCNVYPPKGQDWEREADYVTRVRAHSLFGLPVREFTITCGGNAIS